MRKARRLGIAIAAVMLLAACGSSGGSTTDTPADASVAPTSDSGGSDGSGGSDDSGDDGGGGGLNGSVHFEVSGELSKEGELPFVPMVSFFEHDGPGSAYLIFANADGDTGLYLTVASLGATVTLGSPDLGVTLFPAEGGPIGECTVDADQIDASSASGSFECTNMSAFRLEEYLGAVTLSGTFDARK
jgi:hypothetical protein